ncbi:GlsB/YeaQ/YmgE family stress response membrane protein [Frankia sp. AgB32]|uniref:GlsB/YeaQ/YmgE family stress response membrane protein n=1 Tax=Frankia sp. AgB32 TaxID=631119 RepID=UPI00200D431F|nr:GlsB/YeaQ/YmgE family stress response membrane protein [Frankia sp. AgB32]MCK9893900.1 GlsB/YeaQ/YmgE family stress response membrane protein [Frankia sp. AgB32]
MFQILWIILAGLVIGVLARLIVRGRQDIPLWLTVVIGIVGALVGNVIASAIGVRHTGGIDWIRHILQVGVAIGLVLLVAPLWASRVSGRPHDRHTAGRV